MALGKESPAMISTTLPALCHASTYRCASAAWSIVVAPTGTAYGLAVEPEPNGSHSATILTLAPDSSVRSTLTIVEP